jgi:aminoglycoside 3-N-acetyltransferase
VDQTLPHTARTLAADLSALGLAAGDVVMMHSSMGSLGFVAGGAQAVVTALLDVLGPDGTLVVPTHTPENCDPAGWGNPSVPTHWWPIIRSDSPGFDPQRTPSRWMGVLAETVRMWPGAVRSNHPYVSCAAVGRYATDIVGSHPLADSHGEGSPLGAVNRLDGKVLLIGCGYDSNTSLHLAEARQESPPRAAYGASVRTTSGARWVTYEDVLVDEEDFEEIGEDFEATGAVTVGRLGQSTARLMAQRVLVEFATAWIAANRSR